MISKLMILIKDNQKIPIGNPPSVMKKEDEEDDDMGLDLNDADDEYLDMKKEQMTVDFEKNRLQPGDAGFEYDKRIDFGSSEKVVSSGWDDGFDSDDFDDDDF